MNSDRPEDEEVFEDAITSPDPPAQTQSQVPTRRSARKRKSISEEANKLQTPITGKRHRPLGKMPGVQRSPKSGNADNKRPPSARAGLTVETDPPTNTPTTEHLLLLGGMRAVLKEELGETEARLGRRIAAVEDGFDNLRGNVRGLEKRLDDVEKTLQSGGSYRQRGLEDGDGLDNFDSSLYNKSSSTSRQARYWKARKSLRIWPIKGEGDGLRVELQRFLSQKLRLGEDVLSDAGDCSIRRIPAGRNNKNGITNEVTVEFPTVDIRDAVRGAAYNLAGIAGSGIRLEIPHHLMANFKALNSASYRLKKSFKECKRNIKFDDETSDLVLDFKTGEESGWKKIRPAQAREFLKEEGEAMEELSATDLTDLFEQAGGETRGAEVEEEV